MWWPGWGSGCGVVPLNYEIHMYYNWGMANWEHRAHYITKHSVTVEQAEEALTDPNRAILNPDPTSKSGVSTRTIGYSPSAGRILTVITVESNGITYGVNCWKSNSRDQRIYKEENQ